MIRAATADDFDAIASITAHYVERTAIHFAYAPPAAAELRAQWQGEPRHPWLVDDEGGAVRGYAKAGAWRTRDAYRWSAELGVYLAHDQRRRGLGRALVDALVAELIARGFHTAIAGITLPNPASVGLFERAGFVHVGTFREVGWKLDAWHDVGFWQRHLVAAGSPPPA
ncbi:MAG TPA: GNAT family N-acetyltransferase [Kofleriaceae bacterium]|nr:GNAT family N-acetyltransferase [Kofleriaceae bacterium]